MARDSGKFVRKKSLWAYILPGLVVLLVIAGVAWLVCARLHFEKRLSSFLKAHGMTAEKTEIDWLGNYMLSNIRVEEKGTGNPTVGEVRGQLPLFADDVSLQARNIRYELASVHIFIPELDVEQASVRPASVAGQGQMLSLASLVSAADVKRIVIPELFIRQDSPGSEKATSYQDIAYHDIELTDIAGGRIGGLAGRSVVHYTASDSRAAAESADAPRVQLAAGPFEIHDINAALWGGFFPAGPQAGNREPARWRLHGPYSIRNIVSRSPSDNVAKYYVEEVSGSGLSLAASYGDAGQDMEGGSATRRPIIEMNSSPVEFLKALGPFNMNIKGFILSNLAEVDTYFDKARFSYDGEVMDFVFDNFHVVHNGVKTSLVSIALEKVRFPDFLDVAREVSAWSENSEAARNVDLFIRMTYAAIPRFASVRVDGFSVDLEEKNGTGRIMGLEKLNITAEHRRGAIPTGLHVDISKLQLPVGFFEGRGFRPEAAQDSYLKMLGYNDYLNGSFVLDLKWDEAKQQIVLNELSSDITDLGSFRLWGTIGNVTDTFFVENPVAMAIAATAFRIRDIHLSTDKNGLWQRAVIRRAEQTGKSPEEVRSERIFSVHEILNRTSGDDSGTVSSLEPVFDYLNAGGMLTVDAVAKNPNGVGVYEFIMTPADPYRWLDYFNLKANRQDTDRKG